jgi:hypothetical protein
MDQIVKEDVASDSEGRTRENHTLSNSLVQIAPLFIAICCA